MIHEKNTNEIIAVTRVFICDKITDRIIIVYGNIDFT